jgi:hypothetical protein
MGEQLMKKLLLGMVLFHLALVPCFADVIPTRRGERNTAAEEKVKSRLEQLGIPSSDADRQVRALTPQETVYFAECPERIQVASGLYWYEWVGGLILIGAIILVIILKTN